VPILVACQWDRCGGPTAGIDGERDTDRPGRLPTPDAWCGTRQYDMVTRSPSDGLCSFIYNHMRYTGRYADGLRDGPWKVLNPDASNA
jgi:hypothetical protein